ncbi:type II secretion system protein GspD [Verrucomicrobia bacterium]|nr:type II secretion system protein GspD [Verrucomicrobiota bacterium]
MRYLFSRQSIWLAAFLCLSIGLSSCKTASKTESNPTAEKPPAKAPAAKAPAAKGALEMKQSAVLENTVYNKEYDAEFQQIFLLANRGKWEDAENLAIELHNRESAKPGLMDPSVERVYRWVSKQSQILRDQALEDKIRQIDSKNSVFSPSVKSLVTEQTDRGLPPRKDLRDAVQEIEATPYIPESYNKTKTIIRQSEMFDFTSQQGRMARELNKKVSVKMDDVDLETIIFQIGDKEQINFVADRSLEAFKQKLSINFDDVRLGEFLDYISRNFDLQFQVGDDLIWIVDGKDVTKAIEETRIYRLRKGFVLPAIFGADETTKTETRKKSGDVTTVTVQKAKSFVRDGAGGAPSIESAIKKFFKGTEYEIDYERNIILATGTREQLSVLERIIEEYDRHLQQVLIEARFITVSEAAFLQLGALWETGRNPTSESRSSEDLLGFGPENIGLGLQETFNNILDRDNLSVTLTALEQEGETQTLSAPRLTLINNLPATISDGKVQYYYEEYTITQTTTDRSVVASLVPKGIPKQITSGVKLDVLASIGGDGQSIYLALSPEVNQDVELVPFASVSDASGNSFEIRLPESRTQSLSTRVIVQSGQTVVMGGVLEREQSTYVEAVPILGKIPLIGAAFRRRTEVDKPRYLLIFVTATLLSESGEFLRYEEIPEGEPLSFRSLR